MKKIDSLFEFENYSVRDLYKKLWLNLLTTVLMSFIFVGATYAWFSSFAFTKGNKITTGFMAIDILMSENDLQDKISGTDKTVSDFPLYTRPIDTTDDEENNPEYHYIITNEDVALIKFENAEPGQIYPVKVKLANVGQLAIKYTPSFAVEVDDTGNSLSLNGLQNLDKQKAASEAYLGHAFVAKDYNSDFDLASRGLLTNREYEVRKRVLEREQIDHDLLSETYNQNIGGHLEDVLKVYVGESVDDIKADNYLGTVSDVISSSTAFYQGYLLPYDVVKDDIATGGKTVPIIDGETIIDTKYNVTEYGELNYLIVLPEDTTNLYEYASLVLRVGAQATQVEYEKDGLDIMIYDEGALESSRTCQVTFDSMGGSVVESIIVPKGGLITKPTDPTKKFATFEAWCTDPNNKNSAWSFDSTRVYEDITLYARWLNK